MVENNRYVPKNKRPRFDFNQIEFLPYTPKTQAGKMVYFTSGRSFELPVRDVLNEYASGFKMEPNYETGTYNIFSSCNQRSIQAAVSSGLSHLLFTTCYHGTQKEFYWKYFIVGYYEIGETVILPTGRTAVRAKSMAFTKVENGIEITPELWHQICPNTKLPRLTNLRYATQRIDGDLFNKVVEKLTKHNTVNRFVSEIELAYNLPSEKINS